MSVGDTLYEVFRTFELFDGSDSYQLQLLQTLSTPHPSYRARCYRLVPEAEEGYARWLMVARFPRIAGDTEADAIVDALKRFREFVRQ